MLTSLNVRNFKCFSEFSLPLSSLTILTGFNSAGKSSSFQSLLLLSQSLNHGGSQTRIPFSGGIVDLGSPGDVLYENAHEKALSLGVETDEIRMDWRLQVIADRSGSYFELNEVRALFANGDDRKYSEKPLSLFPIGPESDCGIRQTLTEVIYISAARNERKNFFPSPDMSYQCTANVGPKGEYAPWWFERCSDGEVDELRCHISEEARTLRRQLNAWLGELFQGAEANCISIEKTPFVKLELRSRKMGEWRSPENVGFGVSYVFPILVAGLLAKPGQILIVDSPEAHLHPLGQSIMGQFLAQVAASGVQLVLETHSDHTLNGVRKAVLNKILSPKQIAIHFFYPLNPLKLEAVAETRVISPSIDENGNLSDWPKGFFDQAENDLEILVGWTPE